MISHRPETILLSSLSEDQRALFTAFAGRSPFAAYQQSLAWAENAPRRAGTHFLFFLCSQGGETIGAAVVRCGRMGPLARLATVQRGPIVHDVERLGEVLAALKRALAEAGFTSLVAAPRMDGAARGAALGHLHEVGFVQLPAHDQSLHVVTGKIGLAAAEDAIFASFKQRGRRQIRNAAKQGVEVRPAATAADLAAYQAVTDDFRRRKADYDSKGQPDVAAQARIVAANGGAILLAERGGEVIGGHAFAVQGGEAIWLSMATSNADPSIPRSYLLLWEAMRAARELGCRSYDLAGMSDAGEEGTGRDQFKDAFEPERVELVRAHAVALKPLRHAIFFTARQAYRRWRSGVKAKAK